VINLAASRTKIKNIAAALRCVAEMRQGKACSMADARATAMLIDTALKTSRRTGSALKKRLLSSDNLVTRLLNKMGV
jgi:hypothetical protein